MHIHFQGMKEPGPKLRKAIWHYLADMVNNPYYAITSMMAMRENPELYSPKDAELIKNYSNLIKLFSHLNENSRLSS